MRRDFEKTRLRKEKVLSFKVNFNANCKRKYGKLPEITENLK